MCMCFVNFRSASFGARCCAQFVLIYFGLVCLDKSTTFSNTPEQTRQLKFSKTETPKTWRLSIFAVLKKPLCISRNMWQTHRLRHSIITSIWTFISLLSLSVIWRKFLKRLQRYQRMKSIKINKTCFKSWFCEIEDSNKTANFYNSRTFLKKWLVLVQRF